MTVYIARSIDSGYYLVDSYGTPVCGVWFSHYGDAEDYCIKHELIVGSFEED
jgi:hypothetical protein